MIQFLLLFIAYILKLIILPIGFVLTIFFFLTKPKTFYSNMCTWCGDIAISLDRFGGCVMQFPLNKWFINGSGYQFGNIAETMSGVFGVNKVKGTLLFPGKIICWILDKIQKDHVEKAAKKII